jgi:AcrR family transcriptional regulator
VSYVDQETRRGQLIDATIDVIAVHGVDGATTRRIAEAAGAPLASIHYTFGSKEELVASAVDRVLDDLLAEMRDALAQTSGLAEALAAVMGRVANLLDQPRFAVLMADIPGLDSERMLQMWQRYHEMGRHLVAEAVDRSAESLLITVEQVGRMLIAAIDGVLERFVIDGNTESAVADLEAFARSIAAVSVAAP